MPPVETADDKLRNELMASAEANGAAVVHVPEEDGAANFALSVGAWRRFGAPEVVVIGLPEEVANHAVNMYVQRVGKGERFPLGRVYDDFMPGLRVVFEKVHLGYYPEFLGFVFLFHPQGNFPALQMIVTTPEGHWPWADDAPAGFFEWQPVLTDSGYPESWAVAELA
ncbi:hypothetical protein JOF53_007027 [Crossiella equi]|uniref:DUF4262 domain-containing protein n=1 Tax=Crossiella equi TaxID=130796 RepID=A0ABS5ANJ6_9PSEU|nr:DUF4262 domain-containing protein [Crossiella equi]MBP2478155.1 hypothetical protein [Crossiella equi]